jgi:hypothetical protein
MAGVPAGRAGSIDRNRCPQSIGITVRIRRNPHKMAIVARLLRGEPLELVARETNVSIARLTEWRERAFAGAAAALKEREDRDDEIARLKSKVGGG